MEKVICYIANYEHCGKVLWGTERLKELFQTEEERLQKYGDIKYGWENEAYTYEILSDEAPELLEYMRQLLCTFPGRICVGSSTYGQPLSCYINGESNIRQIAEGVRTDLKYLGERPSVFIMSEHAFHAQLPQLIQRTGFTGAVMRTSFCMYGVNPEYRAACADWYALDKSSHVKTLPTYKGEQCHCAVNGFTHDRRTLEQTFFGANTMDNKILMDFPVDAPWGDLTEFCERFGPQVGVLVAFRDDDPRQPEESVRQYNADPRYKWVLDEEIMESVGDPVMDICPKPEEFRTRMPWGFCGNQIWNDCRRVEQQLYVMDILSAFSDGGYEEEITAGWHALMIAQHHDVQICGLLSAAEEYMKQVETALGRIRAELTVQTDETREVFRWNPLPWKRQDEGGEEGFSVSQIMPAEIVEAEAYEDNRVFCFEQGVLTTPFYRAVTDPEGGFTQLTDLKSDRQVWMSGRRSGILAGYINGDLFLEEGSWNFVLCPDRAVLEDAGHISTISYLTRWTFYKDHPRIDIHTEFEVHGEFIGRRSNDLYDPASAFVHEEKLRLKFYPQLYVTDSKRDAKGMPPDTSEVPFLDDAKKEAIGWHDAPFCISHNNRQYLECNYWSALQGTDNGLAFFNRGIQTLVRESDGAVSIPLAFSMYYPWSLYEKGSVDRVRAPYNAELTAQRAGIIYMDEELRKKRNGEPHEALISEHSLFGCYHADVAMLPFTGDCYSAQLHRRALEYNTPCIDLSKEGARVVCEAGLSVQMDDNLFVSSIFQTNRQLYIRVYEMYGKEGRFSVSAYGNPVRLAETDFLENELSDGSKQQVIVPAHAVREYRIVKET